MKLTHHAVGIAMIAGFGTACAQDSLQIFGVLDLGVRNLMPEGGGSIRSVFSGGQYSSRLGVRGTEDLGGGMSAGFWLESDIAADTGVASGTNNSGTASFWNRRSTVSLSSKSLGEIRLGRDYTPLFYNLPVYDPFGINGVGGSNNLFTAVPARLGSGTTTTTRADNMVKYILPGGLGGVFGEVMASAAEGNGANRSRMALVGYASGAFAVSAGYGRTDNAAYTDTFDMTDIAGSYDFKVVKLTVHALRSTYGARKQTTVLVGATAPLGSGTLKASYIRADQQGAGSDANDADQLALGYVYDVSKRTSLYGHVAKIRNKGVQNFSMGALAPGAGRDISGAEMGITHRF